jgi:hypothetical protein
MKNRMIQIVSVFSLILMLAPLAFANGNRTSDLIASELVQLVKQQTSDIKGKRISYNPFEGAGCLLTVHNNGTYVDFEPAKMEFKVDDKLVVISDELSHTVETIEAKSKQDAAKIHALLWELNEACS